MPKIGHFAGYSPKKGFLGPFWALGAGVLHQPLAPGPRGTRRGWTPDGKAVQAPCARGALLGGVGGVPMGCRRGRLEIGS